MMDEEIYVVVLERDTYEPRDDSRAIVFEQYVDQGSATLEAARKRCKQLAGKYGRTAIAKLQFIPGEGLG